MQRIEGLKELLRSPKKILITTHHKPDADALGSSLALRLYLLQLGHSVTVVTPTDYPAFLNWMTGNSEVIIFEGNEAKCESLANEAELIFCLDFNALSRINAFGEIVRKTTAKKILIDHHLEPEDFATLSFSDTTAAATAELIYDIISDLGDVDLIDVLTGECIYAGIMTDTGSFRHPSTTKKSHLIAAALMEKGVDTSKVHQLIYDNNTEVRLRFLGFSLGEKLVVKKEYSAAYITLNGNELARFDSKTGDTEGLVNFALSIKDINLAVVIIERPDGIKMSFRSKGNFSVNEFARKHFEGGGHKNAAGGRSSLSLRETEKKFLSILPDYQKELNTKS
jgi:bifunctional oligoribonuclease and PAP phosphatase NrnA